MSENFEDELSPSERKVLSGLDRQEQPPPFLEERVVEQLKQSNLLQPRTPWRRKSLRILVATAASLLIFATGAVIGAKWPMRSTDGNSAQFILLLKAGNDRERPRSSEEIKKTVAEYSQWARDLREQGVKVEGEKLKQESRVLGDEKNSSGPGNELALNQRRISGYFVVAAQDYDQAVKIASGCPHLKHGGAIEVRQIDRF